jgi:hypothetical protein
LKVSLTLKVTEFKGSTISGVLHMRVALTLIMIVIFCRYTLAFRTELAEGRRYDCAGHSSKHSIVADQCLEPESELEVAVDPAAKNKD